MRRLILALPALALLGGCQSTNQGTGLFLNAVLQTTIPQVAVANNALAKLDPTIAAACVRIGQAENYFTDAKPLILVFKSGPAIVAKEVKYTAIVDKVCAHPPANVVDAFNQLNAAWAQIQALTTIPVK